jgi:hypothetical protein
MAGDTNCPGESRALWDGKGGLAHDKFRVIDLETHPPTVQRYHHDEITAPRGTRLRVE